MSTDEKQLIIGLDIGIASVGWAVLGENRIAGLGVRTFDRGEDEKGRSLNLTRRQARLARRRLHRRRVRLFEVATALKKHGLIEDERYFREQQCHGDTAVSPWHLRVKALDESLSPKDFARVIYHICKHRGFHWVSKADRAKSDADKQEGGRIKSGLSATEKALEGYRTLAEMVTCEFSDAHAAYRNKNHDYSKSLSRKLLAKEMQLIFKKQREFGNAFASRELEIAILGDDQTPPSGLLWEQKPALSGEDLLKMVGKCTFEREEYRAPKASFAAERHVWLTKLNNLRITVDGTARALNDAERQTVLHLPYKNKSVTYKSVRSKLKKVISDFKFAGLRYRYGADAKDPESQKFAAMPAWHEIKAAYIDAGYETGRKGIEGWKEIEQKALATGESKLLDDIGYVLTVYKKDEEKIEELKKIDALSSIDHADLVQSLPSIGFANFSRLSLKVLRKIVPHMAEGLRYDEACEQVGYNHSSPKADSAESKFLPSLYDGKDAQGRMRLNEELDPPRNPVVLRAINQARSVLNAIIKEYGSPDAIHIELARDLAKSKDERNEIERGQKAYRDRKDDSKKEYKDKENFDHEPTGKQLEKYLLYNEQGCKCAYSLELLDLGRVCREDGYAEIDHILPYSRSYEDGKNNKVLVKTAENRKKGNRTPFEYLDGEGDSDRWRKFVSFVENNLNYRQAKRSKLLMRNFTDEVQGKFRERHLNDTRYVARFMKNFIEQNLKFGDKSRERCVVVSGGLTRFLRYRWGLNKNRGINDRHHALDAAVVAACSRSLVKRVADYSRRGELQYATDSYIDPETGEILDKSKLDELERKFPRPWPTFREDLLREMEEIFVSRPPNRRASGAAHKETIYGERAESNGFVTQKISLDQLKLKDLGVLVDPHRNQKLYQAIRERLEQHGDDAKKAFAEPLHKPSKPGKPTGPVVRSVTKEVPMNSGMPVRGGRAKNDRMIRIDVFRKNGKFFICPLYVADLGKAGLPNLLVKPGANQSEWIQLDDSYQFHCSIYHGELVEIVTAKKDKHTGYYSGCDISTGSISLFLHDRDTEKAKNGSIRGIGVKTAQSIKKYEVDLLGRIYRSEHQERRELA